LPAVHAVPTLAVMTEAGLLESVLGGVPNLASCSDLGKLETALSLPPDPIRRLGALSLWVVEDADRLRERLRLANAEHERLVSMVEGWWRISPADGEEAARRLLYRLRLPQKFTDRVLLAWSRSPAGAGDGAWRSLATLPARWSIPQFPLKAADFMARGIDKGRALGAALRAAEEAWIAQGFPVDPTGLKAIADSAARALQS
jgi:poly(A) polymerase